MATAPRSVQAGRWPDVKSRQSAYYARSRPVRFPTCSRRVDMTLTIHVRQEVDIPDAELLTLAAAVRKKWGRKGSEHVHAEDLLNEAEARGLVSLPKRFRVEDECFTDEELR